MSLRDLYYQARVLTRFDEYLTELAAQKAKADTIAAANRMESDPDLIRRGLLFEKGVKGSLTETSES
ncbi:MAG TPA: hypothetical protein VES73_14570 [Lamprocystis sp. (in: g-proteobacteria)]|nr:hypothetical protein [Lamprocystis sp. (in: g-proteobacteria)]